MRAEYTSAAVAEEERMGNAMGVGGQNEDDLEDLIKIAG